MATRAFQPTSPGYREDGYGWAQHQASLIRAGRTNEIDWENVAEEIESVGKSEASKLQSALRVLLFHLLKWEFQPERRSRSWALTIKEQRIRYAQRLRKNPSMKADLDDVIQDAYEEARVLASRETGIDEAEFPEDLPFTLVDIVEGDRTFG